MYVSYNPQPQAVDDDQSMGEARAAKNVQKSICKVLAAAKHK